MRVFHKWLSNQWDINILTCRIHYWKWFSLEQFLTNHIKNSQKEHQIIFNKTVQIDEVSTVAPPELDLRTTSYEQNHSKDPPEPSPDNPREPSMFSVSFGLSPRTSWGPLKTPKEAKTTPKEPSRTPKDYERTPKNPQGLSKNLPNVQTKPNVQTVSIIPKT